MSEPYVVNPDAIGDPDQTPVVRLSDEFIGAMRRAGLVCACGGMNGYHDDECEDAR